MLLFEAIDHNNETENTFFSFTIIKEKKLFKVLVAESS